MATLLLDRTDLEIRITDGALALYQNSLRTQTVPLRMIDRLVIQGARTRLDSSVLIKLAEAGVSTLLLSPRISRQVAIVLGPAHNDAAVRLAALFISWPSSTCRRKLADNPKADRLFDNSLTRPKDQALQDLTANHPPTKTTPEASCPSAPPTSPPTTSPTIAVVLPHLL